MSESWIFFWDTEAVCRGLEAKETVPFFYLMWCDSCVRTNISETSIREWLMGTERAGFTTLGQQSWHILSFLYFLTFFLTLSFSLFSLSPLSSFYFVSSCFLFPSPFIYLSFSFIHTVSFHRHFISVFLRSTSPSLPSPLGWLSIYKNSCLLKLPQWSIKFISCK